MIYQRLARVKIDHEFSGLVYIGPSVCFIYDLDKKCYTGIVEHGMEETRINLISLAEKDLEQQAVKLLKLAYPSYSGKFRIDGIDQLDTYSEWSVIGHSFLKELSEEYDLLNKSYYKMDTEERRLYDGRWRARGFYRPYGYDKPVELGGECGECESSNGLHASYCGVVN